MTNQDVTNSAQVIDRVGKQKIDQTLNRHINIYKSQYSTQFFNKNQECQGYKKYLWHQNEPDMLIKK